MTSAKSRITLLVASLYPVLVTAQAPTRILYVNAGSPCVHNGNCSTTPCGASWGAAFRKLQDAIACTDNNAATTEHIWVARGTYVPPVTFSLKNTVEIYGRFVGTESSLTQRPPDPDPYTIDATTDSVLSGDWLGNDAIVEPTCPATSWNPTGSCSVECTSNTFPLLRGPTLRTPGPTTNAATVTGCP